MEKETGLLVRYLLIVRYLNGMHSMASYDEIADYLRVELRNRLGTENRVSRRTLQRYIKGIEALFDIQIKCVKNLGYRIADRGDNPVFRYEDMLLDFDLLTSVDDNDGISGYLLAEHHRPKGSQHLQWLIDAIKSKEVIRFDYTNVRKGGEVSEKVVRPHFLKQSQGLWYLLAIDASGKLKVYGVDRISNPVTTGENFRRDESLDPSKMFRDCYGIWDDERMPVEEIELSYSPLDGSFLKTTPLHTSQQVLVDNDEEFRITLRLRITNDFVMALLARSKSLTVIRLQSLRERIREIYRQALERNSD